MTRPSGDGTVICRLDDIPEGGARGFTVDRDGERAEIFVLRRGGTVYAYVNRCPHMGTPLDWAPDRFLSRDRRHILCATHGALFRIEDGFCVAGPCAGDSLEPVTVATDGDAVMIPTEGSG